MTLVVPKRSRVTPLERKLAEMNTNIREAVRELLEERHDQWSLEIITMPSRGDYQGDDYSLALLTRTTV